MLIAFRFRTLSDCLLWKPPPKHKIHANDWMVVKRREINKNLIFFFLHFFFALKQRKQLRSSSRRFSIEDSSAIDVSIWEERSTNLTIWFDLGLKWAVCALDSRLKKKKKTYTNRIDLIEKSKIQINFVKNFFHHRKQFLKTNAIPDCVWVFVFNFFLSPSTSTTASKSN